MIAKYVVPVACMLAGNGAAAQQPGALRSAVDAEITKGHVIVWNSSRPLLRGDFQGPVPADAGNQAAGAAVGLLHAIQCDKRQLEHVIEAIFNPTVSWTKPDALLADRQGDYELAHEQGHFDIAEISARQLRATLVNFAVACDSADKVFLTLGNAASAGNDELERRYDDETVHGTVPAEQARWLAWIRATLDTLPPGVASVVRRY